MIHEEVLVYGIGNGTALQENVESIILHGRHCLSCMDYSSSNNYS